MAKKIIKAKDEKKFKAKAADEDKKVKKGTKVSKKAKDEDDEDKPKKKKAKNAGIEAMAAARKAKASGKGGKTKAKKSTRKPLPLFKAPADFKPHDLLVQVATEKDGLFGTRVKATRFQGRFDREADDKKKFDVGSYDPITLMGIAVRLGGVTYKPTNDRKMPVSPKERDGLKGSNRLPASTTFQVRIRAGRKTADNSLTARIVQIWQAVAKKDSGRMTLKELEKTDPAYRLIRKASRLLPAALVQTQMPPKRGRARKAAEDSED